jgi:hypothetical protein
LWSITLFEVFELGQAGLRKFMSMDVYLRAGSAFAGAR